MIDGLLKSTIGRACVAAVVLQAALVTQAVSAWGQDRPGAPITFAAMTPGGGAGIAPAPAVAETVTWRYPDQPEIVYSAAGAQQERSAPAAAGPRVLDLRRSSGAAAVGAPVAGPDEAPGWLEEEQVGPPYQQAGTWYVPTPEPGYSETGVLAVYGAPGAITESGEAFDPAALSAAHPTLPIPSLIQVTDLTTGRDVIVRLNDRGPFAPGRLVALSPAAAVALGAEEGAQVHVRYLGPAPRRVVEAPTRTQAPAAAPVYAVARSTTIEEGPIAPSTPIAQLPLPPNVGAPLSSSVQRTSFTQAPARGGFTVQLGAFANLENAHALRARVHGAGSVVIEPVRTAQGELFRVRLGPFPTEVEAEAARAAAARLGAPSGVIRPLP